MNGILSIIAYIWAVRVIANLLSFVHLWYVKEYRFDRMRIHFHTVQGEKLYILPWRIPPISPKTMVLLILSFLSCAVLFLLLPFSLIVNVLITDILSFPVTAFFVLVLKIPTAVFHQYRIGQAVKLLRNHAPMDVVGITGSYGKTSTKEYLATILARKFQVLKTEASKNSPIGIAEVVLGHLLPHHDAFVVEMGAYKKGEIAKMADMVQPSVGIVTAINAQHQDLFGSIETTMQAKYELLFGLTGKQIAIVNGDNPHTVEMGKWAARDGKTVWVYTKDTKKLTFPWAQGVVYATNIQADLHGLQFDIAKGKENASVAAPIVGEHQVSNILAAIAGAVACGMSLRDAARAAANLRGAAKVLQQVPGINGSLFINDTFNNNPDAAIAALTVLGKTHGKKYLVFQPMIELGAYADSSHEDVGRIAGHVCDAIILTNKNFYEPFAVGVGTGHQDKKLQVLSSKDAAAYLLSVVHKGDTVLFKGKEAEFVLKELAH